MLRPGVFGRNAADHVDRVLLGSGNAEIGAADVGAPKGLGVDGAALNADDIQFVGD